MDIASFKEKAQEQLTMADWQLVEEAYQLALSANGDGQAAEPWLAVAAQLLELGLDKASLAAALLHKLPEDKVSLTTIESRTGTEVAKLVERLRRLGRIGLSPSARRQAESLRRMLLTFSEDLRVVYIKLADRVEELRHLDFLPPEQGRRLAQESLELYAPLANRLGIWQLKRQLEDLAFAHLEPAKNCWIAEMVAESKVSQPGFLPQAIEQLEGALSQAGIKAEISGRPKHFYSIYSKLNHYIAQGKGFGDIHDLVALRVIAGSEAECYQALGIVHSMWHPLPGEFNDYIANPKENSYRSLHTTVICQGIPIEVQVRTKEMNWQAEFGVAAHWHYKEQGRDAYKDRIAWLRQLVQWHRDLKGAMFVEAVKTDLFPEHVFVFTPKGELIELPAKATPLDFAYRVHTDLGHRCIGSKVNNRIVPLNHELQNGDIVELLVAKKAKGPSRDWLNLSLGYIKTSHAREKIRQWFTRQAREENILRGREFLEKEFRRLGLGQPNVEQLAQAFHFKQAEDLLLAIANGDLSPRQVAVPPTPPEPSKPPPTAPTSPAQLLGVQVMGQGNLLTRTAKCCHPVLGDEVIGYITRNRGITIHRQDCYNIRHEKERERLIPVQWQRRGEIYQAKVMVRAWDRVGLLRDITNIVAGEGVNIASVSGQDDGNNIHTIRLTLETEGVEQLGHILARIETVKGVISAVRSAA